MCQKVVRCVRRSSDVSEGFKYIKRFSGISVGYHVYQWVVRCVSRSSGKSGRQVGDYVVRQVVRCVTRSSGVSEGR